MKKEKDQAREETRTTAYDLTQSNEKMMELEIEIAAMKKEKAQARVEARGVLDDLTRSNQKLMELENEISAMRKEKADAEERAKVTDSVKSSRDWDWVVTDSTS